MLCDAGKAQQHWKQHVAQHQHQMRIKFLVATYRTPSPRSQTLGAGLALDVCCCYLLDRLDQKNAARTGMC